MLEINKLLWGGGGGGYFKLSKYNLSGVNQLFKHQLWAQLVCPVHFLQCIIYKTALYFLAQPILEGNFSMFNAHDSEDNNWPLIFMFSLLSVHRLIQKD